MVAAVVETSGVPERTLKRRFKTATGSTLIGYVQNLRIEEAKRLLETGNTSIEDVAPAVGYENPAFFRRLVPERIGTPTFDLAKPPASSATLKQAENPYFLVAFKSSSAAEIPRFALRVKAVGCGFHSETSFSALSSSGLVRIPAISFTCFLGGTFESLKYAYAKAKSFGAPFP